MLDCGSEIIIKCNTNQLHSLHLHVMLTAIGSQMENSFTLNIVFDMSLTMEKSQEDSGVKKNNLLGDTSPEKASA